VIVSTTDDEIKLICKTATTTTVMIDQLKVGLKESEATVRTFDAILDASKA